MAYTLGSAFYGIYFIVSFPVFYRLDEKFITTTVVTTVTSTELKTIATPVSTTTTSVRVREPTSLYTAVFEAMGVGMIVLILLDICRLIVGIPLHISGVLWYVYKP